MNLLSQQGVSGPRPWILDLFACEGGAGRGYANVGFDVLGVDVRPQPNNPHDFIQGDAIDLLERLLAGEAVANEDSSWNLSEFAAIHASPPCQAFSVATKAWNGRIKRAEHVNLIPPVRELLKAWGGPYVIENVPGAPLEGAIQLCGSSFGLAVRRHRLFESNVPIMGMPCAHHLQTERKYPPTRSDRTELSPVVSVFGAGGGRAKDAALWAEAMGIDWMSKHGLAQAIPPAYTEYIGTALMGAISTGAAA